MIIYICTNANLEYGILIVLAYLEKWGLFLTTHNFDIGPDILYAKVWKKCPT